MFLFLNDDIRYQILFSFRFLFIYQQNNSLICKKHLYTDYIKNLRYYKNLIKKDT